MKHMKKPLSEMDNKELFCALTGEYGVVEQAYLQRAFLRYKALKGDYAEMKEMVRAALAGELGNLDGTGDSADK